jgi:hypothetical protein
VIEGVAELGAEPEVRRFAIQAEEFEHRDVEIDPARPADGAFLGIADRQGRRSREVCRIKPLSYGSGVCQRWLYWACP